MREIDATSHQINLLDDLAFLFELNSQHSYYKSILERGLFENLSSVLIFSK